MNLKTEIKTVFQVEYLDLERLIEETYNIKEYSIPATELCGNDVYRLYDVTKEMADEWEEEVLVEVKAGKHMEGSLSTVLIDLCRTGVIDSGTYLIRIWW